MDALSLSSVLTVLQAPLVPGLHTQDLARPLLWALTLGGVVHLVLLWVALPGSASLAYWLAQAFQMPSLSSAALGLGYLWRVWRGPPMAGARAGARVGARAATACQLMHSLRWLAVLLGWLLLLDLLALLPLSLYGLGFGTPALGVAVSLLLLFWLRWGAEPAARPWLALAAAVLLLFVLTRWPSGNLWDALLDPL
ncbi:MAG: hypothetical protein EBY25_09805, partial [Betaproteobacteria bacterium]|nr:hypothetical protein [Betaproteobacteria bacterium]